MLILLCVVLTESYFQQFLLSSLKVDYSVIIEPFFHIVLVVIHVNLNVKPLKKEMNLWVLIIACPDSTSLYMNYMNNRFIPVVQKRILDIMLPVRTLTLCESILVDSLVYFFCLHPHFASIC